MVQKEVSQLAKDPEDLKTAQRQVFIAMMFLPRLAKADEPTLR
jgi:hypothetical protein